VTVRRVGGVLLDGEDLALAEVLVRLGVAYLRYRDGTVPAAAVRMREQLTGFARETTAAQASAAGESAKPSAAVIVAESAPAEMNVQEAAGLLGISPQAVRRLCRTGALVAALSPAGRWDIDPGSAAALAARRRRET
jgi:hypothetical protein